MKSFLLVLTFLFINASLLIAQNETVTKPIECHRGLEWGMTMSDVKAALKTCEDLDKEKLIEYGVKLDNRDALVHYQFAGDKLCNIIYLFEKLHTDPSLYIKDYEEVEKELTNKYGVGKTDYQWKDTKYKDDVKYHGFAVSRGMLVLETSRPFNNGRVVHLLSGTIDTNIKHCIHFENTQLLKTATK